MSEVLRQVESASDHRLRSREQITLNLAEFALLSVIDPLEAVRSLEAQATTLAIDPELELKQIGEDELIKYS